MKNIISFVFILLLAVLCSACVNNYAVKELNDMAADFIKEGDYPSAISRLESSIDLDGSIYESRYNLAVAYVAVEECTKALEQIQVAKQLLKDKDEPAVYYTYGVAANCAAEHIYKRKNERGMIEEIKYSGSRAVQAKEDYIGFLTKALEAFKKYTELAPNADDTESVLKLISDIEAEINNNNK